MSIFFTFIYRLLKKRKLLFILLLLLSIGFCVFLAPQIKLEQDITKMMPSDAKTERIHSVLKNSSFLDRFVVTVSATDSTKDPGTDELISYTDSLVDAILHLPSAYIKEVNAKVSDEMMYSLYNTFLNNLPLFLESTDYITLDHLITPEKLDTTLQKNYRHLLSPASLVMKKNILQDPIGITPYALKRMQRLQLDDQFELDQGYIFTKDKKHLLFFIVPAMKSNETEKNTKFLTALDSIMDVFAHTQPQVHAEYFGSAAVAAGNAEQVKKDVMLTMSITIIGLFLFISFFFKRLEVFFIIFIPVAFGAAFSLALLYLFKGEISGIALGAGSIILGIAMDYTIHFYTHFKHTGSAEQTVKDLSFPLTLGSTTTIGALLSLLFVKSEALQDFGMFAAFSLMGAALFTLVIFPHIVVKRKVIPSTGKTHQPNVIERIAAYRFDKNNYLLAFILLLVVVSIFTFQKVEFESDMMKMNYMDKQLADAEQRLNNISDLSLKNIYIVSKGKNLEEALSSSEKNLPVLKKLEGDHLIRKYATISSLVLSKAEQQQRIRRWNTYWTDEKKETLKKRLIEKSSAYKFKANAFREFYALLDKSYAPIGLEAFREMKTNLLDNYINQQAGETTIITILKTTSENEDTVYTELTKNPELIVFDKKFLTNQFVEIIKNNFNLILTISSLLVLIMLIISYGRLELALITYIPMVLSWLCILGIMGIWGLKFNIINIIVSTFIFGLGDDYSIFITDGLLKEYKTGEKNLESYKTGIFISAITTMIGIGVLVFASHPALKSIGLITVIGMFCVLIISNTIQPILFRFFITNRTDKKRVPFTLLSMLQSILAFIYFAAGCIIMMLLGFIIIKLVPAPLKTRKRMYHQLRHSLTKSMIYVNVHVRKKIINTQQEQFEKPAIVICNHHSVIDSLLMQSLNPKLILMVNDWVWKDAFMGPIVRLGGFIPKEAGYDENLVKIKVLISEGYSLAIFPEGSRSPTAALSRFHKGAFFMAEKLNVDIVPVIFHGTAFVQGKDDNFLLKKGRITVKYLPRISPDDKTFGEGYAQRTKLISRYFKNEYAALRKEIETVDYFVNRISKNYIYKGPVLEWYMRIKIKLEDHYRLFESLLPAKGVITDIGCGYGFLPYMLHFTSGDRKIIGMDYDAEKIAIADHCFSKNEQLTFIATDATKADLPASDAFVLSDILHYLPRQAQEDLLIKCFHNLNPGGVILLRDADKDLEKRHIGTRYTEFFSTNFGFNKTTHKLEFVSSEFIIDIVRRNNMTAERIDNTRLTSNITYLIKQKK